jgi:hypothetical protein
VSDLQTALEPIAATLEADGYRLETLEKDGRLQVQIAAGPDACEDCLVPKSMMQAMIADTLARFGVAPAMIDLRYPGE